MTNKESNRILHDKPTIEKLHLRKAITKKQPVNTLIPHIIHLIQLLTKNAQQSVKNMVK